MSELMWAQGEARGFLLGPRARDFLLGPTCPRLSSWAHIRLVSELGKLAGKWSIQASGHML